MATNRAELPPPRWAILGNCQTPLWADALAVLAPSLILTHTEHVGMGGRTLADAVRDAAETNPDAMVVLPDFMDEISTSDDASMHPPTEFITVPAIGFTGFHPDLAYVRLGSGAILNSRGGHWNSKILFWCFMNGISTADALELFTSDVFEELGYFNSWRLSSAALRFQFEATDHDFASWMHTVKRSGVFMHGINHPKPIAIAALARRVLERHLSLDPISVDSALGYLPDRLASHCIWPVHAAAAQHLSVPPMDAVKFGDTYVAWPQFAAECFEYWSSFDLTEAEIHYIPSLEPEQETVLARLTGITS